MNSSASNSLFSLHSTRFSHEHMMAGLKRSASRVLHFFQTATLGGNLNGTILRQEWFFNTRRDIMAGAVVGLALIPEAIAFSIIAGINPKVGLYEKISIG
jgi:SulP family sulfate permease